MGILNVTPDSFFDGAEYQDAEWALAQAQQMIEDGADIIDIGGESTRPGAPAVSVEEEIARVIPVIAPIKALGVPISIDTSKPEVILAAAEAGADMLNDVRALSLPGAMAAAAKTQLPVCIMHMQGQPQTMQRAPSYVSVVEDVMVYLKKRMQACERAGIDLSLLTIDPGFGFGKTLAHNLALLQGISRLKQLGVPVLAGLSRKSMLGQITGRDVDEREAASLAAALIAMQRGATIIRVHDVKPTWDVRQVYLATQNNHH